MLPGIYSALSCYPLLKWANISIVLVFLVVSSFLLLVPKYSLPEYKFSKFYFLFLAYYFLIFFKKGMLFIQ